MAFFDLRLRTQSTLLVDGEASDYVSEYKGELVCIHEESGEEVVAGSVRAQKLLTSLACDRGESLFDVCDSHSQEMHVLQTLLYYPDSYEFREALVARFEAFHRDLLVLDYILLDPKWRGLKVGLLAARKMIDLLGGGCGLVVSDITPLHRDAHMTLDVPAEWIPQPTTSEGRSDARIRLRGYYRQMGFTRLGRSPFYALSTTLETPSAEELLRPHSSADE